MGTLSFDPLIAPALWLALAATGVALLVMYGWRRPEAVPRRRWAWIMGLSSLGMLLVLGVLLNPTWVEPAEPPAGRPVLTVLVDATASMATPDGPASGHPPDKQSRYHASARLAAEFAKQLGGRFDVRTFTFADKATVADIASLETKSPDGAVTDLAAAIGAALEDDQPPGRAVILMSDGIHNGGGGAERVLEMARLAKALACPVYTWTVGGDASVKDVAVELRSPQELAFVNQAMALGVQIRQRGFGGSTVTLVLEHEGKEVDRKQVPLPIRDGTVDAEFKIKQEKPGLYRYEVRAEPLPEEVSRANNSATLLLRVVDKPVRVLLLEGKPYWDAKFLARTLLADASVELDTVVRLGESRYLKRTVRRPPTAEAPPVEEWAVTADCSGDLANPETLRGYQVVILGRDADVFLSDPALSSLRSWVARDGGSLVCYRGQPEAQVSQRLGQMLPVAWAPARESRFRVHVTDRGRDLRWFPANPTAGDTPADLPTLATGSRAEQPKPLAVVLATARGQIDADDPAVTYQPYGTGRVVAIEGAGMWRWAFLPPQRQQHDDVYRSLWSGLVRWLAASADLMPGQKLALRSDKVRFNTTEPVTATLLVREEGGDVPAIELTGDGLQGKRSLRPAAMGEEPGVFRVAFGSLPEGRYQARVAGATAGDATAQTAFDVRSPAEEQLDLAARPDLMARIAAESGAAALSGEKTGDLVGQFREHRDKSRMQRVIRLAAWDRWWLLLLAFAVWATAWGLRRSSGLV
jgi:hypothetical protein